MKGDGNIIGEKWRDVVVSLKVLKSRKHQEVLICTNLYSMYLREYPSLCCYSICERSAVRKITRDRHVRNGLRSCEGSYTLRRHFSP